MQSVNPLLCGKPKLFANNKKLSISWRWIALSIVNAELAADALRVRELFAQIQSRRSPDLERSHHRIERCKRLLSEAYSLAGEGEGLLRERDARLETLK